MTDTVPIDNRDLTGSVPVAEIPPPIAKSLDTSNLTIHLPVDARGAALGILATVALIFALNWMQPFLITLLLGILFAYTLNPLVVRFERIKIPRPIGTSIVMLVVLSALVFGAYGLRGQVQQIVAQLPEAVKPAISKVKIQTG